MLDDVDYYPDMEKVLADPCDTLLSTFNPSQAGKPLSDNYGYTFVGDTVIMSVSGGAEYKHEIWDYSSDCITCSNFMALPWNWRTSNYLVERRNVDDDHQIILLNLQGTWKGWRALLANYFHGARLSRRKYQHGAYTVLRTLTTTSDVTSVCKQGQYNACTADTRKIEWAIESHKNSKVGQNNASLWSMLKSGDTPQEAMPTLLSYVREEAQRPTYQVQKVYKVSYGLSTYQFYPGRSNIGPSPLVIPYMQPVLDGAFAPSKEHTSYVKGAVGRVVELRKPSELTPNMLHLIRLFVDALVDEDIRHSYIPVDDDELYERQNRPSQRHIIEMGVDKVLSNNVCSHMQKAETYGEIKDPRCISIVEHSNKITFSKYCYAVSQFLKQETWYAFAKTPLDIAETVASICSSSDIVQCTDAKRMDGNKGVVPRVLEMELWKTLFPYELHDEIEDYLERQRYAPVYTSQCGETPAFKYCSQNAQLSGGANTSNSNTCDMAFLNWLAYYFDNGKDPQKAVKLLRTKAIVAGDDNLAGDVSMNSLTGAGKLLGYPLTGETYTQGQEGINFISRIYGPYVWGGDPCSHTDIPRALAKLHTAPRMPANVTASMKLDQKLTSLWFTDEHTPVINVILSTWIRLGGEVIEQNDHLAPLVSYWAQYDKYVQYPNEGCEDWANESLKQFSLDDLYEYLARITTRAELLTMPSIQRVAPSQPSSDAILHRGDQAEYIVGKQGDVPLPEVDSGAQKPSTSIAEAIVRVDPNHSGQHATGHKGSDQHSPPRTTNPGRNNSRGRSRGGPTHRNKRRGGAAPGKPQR
jgi:hypothetical protein